MGSKKRRKTFTPQPKRLFIPFTCLGTLVTLSIILTCYLGGFFHTTDLLLYDILLTGKGTRPSSQPITLVLLDDASARELKKPRGPWPRIMIAKALDNLCKSGANVIGMDLIFSTPSTDTAADHALATAMQKCNNIVLARIATAQGSGHITALPLFMDSMIGDGFIDLPLDEDEILRKIRYLAAHTLDDGSLELIPSFALELARVFSGVEYALDFSNPDVLHMGTTDGPQFLLPFPELMIFFHGDNKTFRRISLADVIQKRYTQDDVQGRLLIIGSASTLGKDWFSTPFSRFYAPDKKIKKKFAHLEERVQRTKDLGVATHAFAVETILSGTFIRPVPQKTVLFFIVLALVSGLTFYFPGSTMPRLSLLLLVGHVSIFIFSWNIFSYRLLWIPTMAIHGTWLGQAAAGIIVQRILARKKEARITSIFGRYVAPSVVNQLLDTDMDDVLGGHSREVSILFSDIRGFTTLSEQLGPEKTAFFLNTYFDTMIPIIMEHGGTVDKLMGDAVMAFFGAPVHQDDHALRTAKAAHDMTLALHDLKRTHPDLMHGVDMGVGIASGAATVGNLGSSQFMDYTVIGDTVNLASRLEGLTKAYGMTVLMNQQTAQKISPVFTTTELDIVRVKGKHEPVPIHCLLGKQTDMSSDVKALGALFKKGLEQYRNQNWRNARTIFEQLLASGPFSATASRYLNQCMEYQKKSPPKDWKAETVFTTK